MRRIGVLVSALPADDPDGRPAATAFVQALQELGWTDGRNVRIVYRFAVGDADRLRRYAAELVALAPDVILAGGTPTVAGVATGDPHSADRVRECRRSGRARLGRQPGAARRQHQPVL